MSNTCTVHVFSVAEMKGFVLNKIEKLSENGKKGRSIAFSPIPMF